RPQSGPGALSHREVRSHETTAGKRCGGRYVRLAMTGILTNASELHFRIWSEFHTMPGLRLTFGQACRLLGAEPSEVAAALHDLVEESVLRQIGPYYVRADFGRFT